MSVIRGIRTASQKLNNATGLCRLLKTKNSGFVWTHAQMEFVKVGKGKDWRLVCPDMVVATKLFPHEFVAERCVVIT